MASVKSMVIKQLWNEESVFELSIQGMLLISSNGIILKANRAASDLFGAKLKLEGISIKELFFQDPPKELNQLLEKAKNSAFKGKEFMLMMGRNEDQAFWANFHISSLSNKLRDPEIFLVQIQNISDLKKVTEEVNHHNHLLNELINNIPDNIFIKDKDSRFILANRSVTRLMVGPEEIDLTGKTDFDFYPRKMAQKFRNDELKVLTTGKAQLNIVEQVIDPEHNRHWYSTSKIALRNRNGEIIGIMGIGRNITDLVKEKKALRKAKLAAEKADNLKSAFLANLSHEVRTPLNGILGFSQFLKKSFTDDPRTYKYLEYIIRNGKRLLHLISDIVDLSKMECQQLTLNPKKFSPAELMKKLERSLHIMLEEEDKHHIVAQLEIDPAAEDAILFYDDQRVEQILYNLLSNAVKFTDSGTIKFGYSLLNDKLRFFVKDTGIGIHPKDIPRIFERFNQLDNSLARQYEGAGLGLSIVKGLIHLIKSKIEVQSTPGKGSEFSFNLSLKV